MLDVFSDCFTLTHCFFYQSKKIKENLKIKKQYTWTQHILSFHLPESRIQVDFICHNVKEEKD